MAISLGSAQAAVTALRGLDGQKLFSSMAEAGPHLFAKHMSKDAAHKAAVTEHSEQGYFKKIGTKPVPDMATFRALTPREKSHVVGLPQGRKVEAKSFGRAKDIHLEMTMPVTNLDFASLISATIRQDAYRYCQSGQQPEQRFLYVTDIPAGFVGRSIDENKMKSDELDYAVMVISAAGGANPFVLTLYPATAAYVNARPTLA